MKQSKRGFTIVELVIVIAVIAVLAAVLIPTFSSLVKKANLSADMQAVREMNIALRMDEELNGRPEDVETVMQVLADAGFNTVNWQTLSANHAVYWYKEENIMVLYNTKDAIVEYPTDFDSSLMVSKRDSKGNELHFVEYNENKKKAIAADFNIDSSAGAQDVSAIISSSSASASTKAALASVQSNVATNAAIRSSMGLQGDNFKVLGVTEYGGDNGSGTYAAMQIMSVSDSDTAKYTSSGEVKKNLFYLSMKIDPNATAAEITAAKKQAGENVYMVFVKVNEGQVENSGISLVLEEDMQLDLSGREWAPVKTLNGYFGSPNPDKPAVLTGGKLTSSTTYSQTVTFDGSAGKYFVTGFIGAVFGDTTIENVTFKSFHMEKPASDFDIKAHSNMEHSRNSIGMIGGVIDDPDGDKNGKSATNVVIRNVIVDNQVEIVGAATAAGLVGYIGGSGNSRALFNGTLLLENCQVAATVEGGPEWGGYGPCGGLIGFFCRTAETSASHDGTANNNEIYQVIIRDCSFTGKVDGYQAIGAAVGNLQYGMLVFEGDNDFSSAKLNTKALSTGVNYYGLIGASDYANNSVVYFSTADSITLPDGVSFYIGSKDGKSTGRTLTTATDLDTRTASFTKFDTIKKGDANIGGNNGIVD